VRWKWQECKINPGISRKALQAAIATTENQVLSLMHNNEETAAIGCLLLIWSALQHFCTRNGLLRHSVFHEVHLLNKTISIWRWWKLGRLSVPQRIFTSELLQLWLRQNRFTFKRKQAITEFAAIAAEAMRRCQGLLIWFRCGNGASCNCSCMAYHKRTFVVIAFY